MVENTAAQEFTGHGEVRRHGPVERKREERGDDGAPGAGAVFGGGARRNMDVDGRVREKFDGRAYLGRVCACKRVRYVGAFLHHVPQLACATSTLVSLPHL